jgi:hypothetical protein
LVGDGRGFVDGPRLGGLADPSRDLGVLQRARHVERDPRRDPDDVPF